MNDKEKENNEFKRGLIIFGGINIFLLIVIIVSVLLHFKGLKQAPDHDSLGYPIYHSDSSFVTFSLKQVLKDISSAIFFLPLIQLIYVIPAIIICLFKKNYGFLTAALLVGATTLLIGPVTCAIDFAIKYKLL